MTHGEMVAIMLVKGKSERLLNKNFIYYKGEPLWFGVAKTVLQIPAIYELIIVSDIDSDSEIKSTIDREAMDKFVKVVCRPSDFDKDATSESVLYWLLTDKFPHIHSFVLFQATNPMIKRTITNSALKKHFTNGCDNIVSINPYTCKEDGTFYFITTNKFLQSTPPELFTRELWVTPAPLVTTDIDEWSDLCISLAISEGRVI